MAELVAEWNSIAYPRVSGIYKMYKSDNAGQIKCTVSYTACSSFMPGEIKKLELGWQICGDGIFIARGELSHELILSIKIIIGETVTGYYSSVNPIDCGIVRPVGTPEEWKYLFL